MATNRNAYKVNQQGTFQAKDKRLAACCHHRGGPCGDLLGTQGTASEFKPRSEIRVETQSHSAQGRTRHDSHDQDKEGNKGKCKKQTGHNSEEQTTVERGWKRVKEIAERERDRGE